MPTIALAKQSPQHNFTSPTTITVTALAPPGVGMAKARLEVVQSGPAQQMDVDSSAGPRKITGVKSVKNIGPATVNITFD
jgi:hypothetical protein